MIELLASLDKYIVQDGKEITIQLKCPFTGPNITALVGIGIGAAVKIEDTQQQLPLEG
ncbi:MAG: hypothetical protein IT366_21380 [Candidatus Hydrogenedentes bacterium]|nr:hypothetical protein [Candidatus Hydrogenedentota bacterium]